MSSRPQPDTFADDLMAELASLEGRPYEEIGVPTFFIGEDLTSGRPVVRKGGDTNPVGATFAALAGALASRRDDLTTEDIGKLMEVFSDRHFPAYDTGTPIARSIQDAAFAAAEILALPEAVVPALAELVSGMAGPHVIRAVNFHATPRYREVEFRRQLAAYAEAFEPVTADNIAAAIAGEWPHERPGLIPMLFEGFRDNFDVMLPILEEYGFTGWFFVPTIFPGMAADEQRAFAAEHDLDPALLDEYPGERIAMTWDEAREISRRGHIFACHSRTHNEVTAETAPSVLEDEIVLAKAEMERELGRRVDIFCWLGGACVGVNPEADRLLRETGFRYLFSNFKIQKLQ